MDVRGIKDSHTAPQGTDCKRTLSQLIKYVSISILLELLFKQINVKRKHHSKSVDVKNKVPMYS